MLNDFPRDPGAHSKAFLAVATVLLFLITGAFAVTMLRDDEPECPSIVGSDIVDILESRSLLAPLSEFPLRDILTSYRDTRLGPRSSCAVAAYGFETVEGMASPARVIIDVIDLDESAARVGMEFLSDRLPAKAPRGEHATSGPIDGWELVDVARSCVLVRTDWFYGDDPLPPEYFDRVLVPIADGLVDEGVCDRPA